MSEIHPGAVPATGGEEVRSGKGTKEKKKDKQATKSKVNHPRDLEEKTKVANDRDTDLLLIEIAYVRRKRTKIAHRRRLRP